MNHDRSRRAKPIAQESNHLGVYAVRKGAGHDLHGLLCRRAMR